MLLTHVLAPRLMKTAAAVWMPVAQGPYVAVDVIPADHRDNSTYAAATWTVTTLLLCITSLPPPLQPQATVAAAAAAVS